MSVQSQSARQHVSGITILIIVCLVTAAAAVTFRAGRADTSDAWGPFATATPVTAKKLSDYLPTLAGTPGDTGVFVLKGAQPGGTVMVLGGTHGDEVAGVVAAILLLENAQVQQGTLIVVPRANNSAATHGLPQEGYPASFTLTTASGVRRFRIGSRVTNPAHQWPDPEVYVEPNAHQELAGVESRNLNRAYPGVKDGNLTQRVAYAIEEIIRQEHVDLAFDLHEASPEYPTVNAIVAHPRAMDLAATAAINLEMVGIPYNLEPSPENLRGLSHREWGDTTDTMAILMETANPFQGRLRSVTNAALAVTGVDPQYKAADAAGRLFAPYPDGGYSLSWRVARHITALKSMVDSLGELYPEKGVIINGIPSYDEIISAGAEAHLGKVAR